MLVVASPAAAAIFMRLATVHAHRGGLVHIFGNPRQMPPYALPARKTPCIRVFATRQPMRRAIAPRRPFILLGRAPGKVSANYDYTSRSFTRLPRALPAGKYVIFVWCASRGGSLISAGTNPPGRPQILHVRR